MTKLQCFALGMVLATIGVVAVFQVIQIDHVMKIISIEALGAISVLASMVFFTCAFRDRGRE